MAPHQKCFDDCGRLAGRLLEINIHHRPAFQDARVSLLSSIPLAFLLSSNLYFPRPNMKHCSLFLLHCCYGNVSPPFLGEEVSMQGAQNRGRRMLFVLVLFVMMVASAL